MESDEEIRSAKEAACRVLGLLGVVGLAQNRERATEWIVKHEIAQHFCDREARFYADDDPQESDVIHFSWSAEAITSLIWALKGLEAMPALTEQFDPTRNELVRSAMNDPAAFVSSAELRDDAELEEMESYLYHQHWRVRDRDHGFNTDDPDPDDPPIEQLNTSIVTERRLGMTWLVAGDDEDWDETPLDT